MDARPYALKAYEFGEQLLSIYQDIVDGNPRLEELNDVYIEFDTCINNLVVCVEQDNEDCKDNYAIFNWVDFHLATLQEIEYLLEGM